VVCSSFQLLLAALLSLLLPLSSKSKISLRGETISNVTSKFLINSDIANLHYSTGTIGCCAEQIFLHPLLTNQKTLSLEFETDLFAFKSKEGTVVLIDCEHFLFIL
jgi:hypothetical protein